MDSKTVSNVMLLAAAAVVLVALLDARVAIVLSVVLLVGFAVYYRRTR